MVTRGHPGHSTPLIAYTVVTWPRRLVAMCTAVAWSRRDGARSRVCTAVAWSHTEMVSGCWVYSHHGNLSGCFCTLARDLRGLLAPLVSSSLVFLIQGPALLSRSLGLGVGEGNGTPLQYSCLENPMDGGAGKAGVHGVAEGQTRLSAFTFTFHFHALEREMATHSSVLAWRIPEMGEPGGLPSVGSQSQTRLK